MARVGKIIGLIRKLQLAYGRGYTFMTSARKSGEGGGSLEVCHAFASEGISKLVFFVGVINA